MSAESQKPTPINPGWLSFGAMALTTVVSCAVAVAVGLAVGQRDSSEQRARQDALESRVSIIERRFSEEQLSTRETLVALKKDMESANKTLTLIQGALMVRPTAASSSSTP